MIRAAHTPLTYKEVSDKVTQANYQAILEEADRRSPDLSFDSAHTKGKNGTVNENGELTDSQFRAVENYRRRIYDSWSVLRAANIISKVDRKRFKYNRSVLEGLVDEPADDKRMTVTADKLKRILETINRI